MFSVPSSPLFLSCHPFFLPISFSLFCFPYSLFLSSFLPFFISLSLFSVLPLNPSFYHPSSSFSFPLPPVNSISRPFLCHPSYPFSFPLPPALSVSPSPLSLLPFLSLLATSPFRPFIALSSILITPAWLHFSAEDERKIWGNYLAGAQVGG